MEVVGCSGADGRMSSVTGCEMSCHMRRQCLDMSAMWWCFFFFFSPPSPESGRIVFGCGKAHIVPVLPCFLYAMV